jgi:coronin-1B/1C/6
VKIWEVPSADPDTNPDVTNLIKDPIAVLEGYTKRMNCLKFSPTVDNCLASASQDGTMIVWDVEKSASTIRVDCKDASQSIDWDYYGNLVCGMFRDKALRVVDPRLEKVAMHAPSSSCHKGTKPARAIWLSQRNQGSDRHILSVGFSNSAKREMFLWDTRKLGSGPTWTNTIDDNSGVIYPYYDESSGLLFLVGRGDGNIRFYEFADSSVYYLNDHRSTTPQRGFAMFPKRVVDTEKNEIDRFLKLDATAVQTLSFFVPRRSDVGSADLYPECPAGEPAIASVDEWSDRTDEIAPVMKQLSVSAHGTPNMRPSLPTPSKTTVPTLPPVAPVSEDEYRSLKSQLHEANKTIEEQKSKIQRLEVIVMNTTEPTFSPPPVRRTQVENALVEELQSEVTVLKEKVVKLMNENARLRMNFSIRASAPTTAPAPIQPVARSPPVRTPLF